MYLHKHFKHIHTSLFKQIYLTQTNLRVNSTFPRTGASPLLSINT